MKKYKGLDKYILSECHDGQTETDKKNKKLENRKEQLCDELDRYETVMTELIQLYLTYKIHHYYKNADRWDRESEVIAIKKILIKSEINCPNVSDIIEHAERRCDGDVHSIKNKSLQMTCPDDWVSNNNYHQSNNSPTESTAIVNSPVIVNPTPIGALTPFAVIAAPVSIIAEPTYFVELPS